MTPSTLPLSSTQSTVTATLTGLQPASTIHYRVVATNTAGTTTGPDYTITTQTPVGTIGTAGTSGSTTNATPPTIRGLTETHTVWRTGQAKAVITSQDHRRAMRKVLRPPVGTTFRFNLNETADAAMTFIRLVPGRQSGGLCHRQTSRNRSHRSCVLALQQAGQLDFTGHAGPNSVVFDGRLQAARVLGPGTYQMDLTATTTNFVAGPNLIKFTISR
jgi:hypothetical protein